MKNRRIGNRLNEGMNGVELNRSEIRIIDSRMKHPCKFGQRDKSIDRNVDSMRYASNAISNKW